MKKLIAVLAILSLGTIALSASAKEMPRKPTVGGCTTQAMCTNGNCIMCTTCCYESGFCQTLCH